MDKASRVTLGRHPQWRRSCTGRTGSAPRARSFPVHHVIDIAPTVLEPRQDCPNRPSSTGSDRRHGRRSASHYVIRRRAPRPSATNPVLRDVLNRGIYHQGWTAVTRHSTPWAIGSDAARSTMTCGSSTTQTMIHPARNIAAENPQKLAELQRSSSTRPTKQQRAARSTTAGWNGSTQTWPAGPSYHGQHAAPVGGMGRLTRGRS